MSRILSRAAGLQRRSALRHLTHAPATEPAVLVRAFVRFVRANPHYPSMFTKFTLQAIQSGRSNYGASTIVERMRWHTGIENTGGEFKVCENHAAGFARLFEIQHPRHAGFFRKKCGCIFDAPEARDALRKLARELPCLT